jgi:glycosyltransferase involved in cell wall biosynthesis
MREDFGEIVPGRSPEALIEALRRLLADPALRKQKGGAAREFALTQSFSRSAAALASLLQTS